MKSRFFAVTLVIAFVLTVACGLTVTTTTSAQQTGLKRAGRDLSREKLITALEGLYEYNTGVTPSITFGPNRRVGAMGAYVLSIDPAKREFVSSGWVNN